MNASYLEKFIDNTFNLSYKDTTHSFSSKSETFIKTFFSHLCEANKSFKHMQRKLCIFDTVLDYKGENYNHIPKKIQTIIETTKKYGKKIQFTIGDRTINVNFFSFSIEKQNTNAFFLDCIKKIYLWLFIADKYAFKKCSLYMNIYIYFTNEIKQLPETNKDYIISETNASTGFTTWCQEKTEINIYRLEEWFKVFIHETFHNLGLEFSVMNIQNGSKKLFSHFPIKMNFLFFETYCEVWAEIIHILFVSFFSIKSNKYHLFINCAEDLLETQQLFSIFQCAKVLKFNGLSYTDLYDMNNNNSHNKRLKYKENTEVLAYYVFKSVLLYHYNYFIEWCIIHNGKNVIAFSKKQETVSNYCDLIIYLYKFHNEKFLKIYKKMEEWIQYKKSVNNIEDTTMRMTIID